MQLQGKWVLLETLDDRHRESLRHAANDPRIWQYTASKGAGDDFDTWWNIARHRQTIGTCHPFAVILRENGAIVGSTRLMDITPAHRRLEIGNTWYVPAMWATAVNPECKMLLLQHAFESMAFNRVEFRTDALNLRSRAAIRKIGGTEEGVLRSHMIVQNGRVRDTVLFSIIRPEWPGLKTQLQELTDRSRAPEAASLPGESKPTM